MKVYLHWRKYFLCLCCSVLLSAILFAVISNALVFSKLGGMSLVQSNPYQGQETFLFSKRLRVCARVHDVKGSLIFPENSRGSKGFLAARA